jgi:hypothetical protein
LGGQVPLTNNEQWDIAQVNGWIPLRWFLVRQVPRTLAGSAETGEITSDLNEARGDYNKAVVTTTKSQTLDWQAMMGPA